MECCGKRGYSDYSYQGYFPESCCKERQCRVENVYKVGCQKAFHDFWDTNSDIIKYAGLAIAAIEVS